MTGAEVLNQAAQQVGERYMFRATVPESIPNWRGPWDDVTMILLAPERSGRNPAKIDGVFESHTAAAVTGFQLTKALLPDEEVVLKTAAALGVRLN
jgi:hypothetical protein